jgi:hypothetical protein
MSLPESDDLDLAISELRETIGEGIAFADRMGWTDISRRLRDAVETCDELAQEHKASQWAVPKLSLVEGPAK